MWKWILTKWDVGSHKLNIEQKEMFVAEENSQYSWIWYRIDNFINWYNLWMHEWSTLHVYCRMYICILCLVVNDFPSIESLVSLWLVLFSRWWLLVNMFDVVIAHSNISYYLRLPSWYATWNAGFIMIVDISGWWKVRLVSVFIHIHECCLESVLIIWFIMK